MLKEVTGNILLILTRRMLLLFKITRLQAVMLH